MSCPGAFIKGNMVNNRDNDNPNNENKNEHHDTDNGNKENGNDKPEKGNKADNQDQQDRSQPIKEKRKYIMFSKNSMKTATSRYLSGKAAAAAMPITVDEARLLKSLARHFTNLPIVT